MHTLACVVALALSISPMGTSASAMGYTAFCDPENSGSSMTDAVAALHQLAMTEARADVPAAHLLPSTCKASLKRRGCAVAFNHMNAELCSSLCDDISSACGAYMDVLRIDTPSCPAFSYSDKCHDGPIVHVAQDVELYAAGDQGMCNGVVQELVLPSWPADVGLDMSPWQAPGIVQSALEVKAAQMLESFPEFITQKCRKAAIRLVCADTFWGSEPQPVLDLLAPGLSDSAHQPRLAPLEACTEYQDNCRTFREWFGDPLLNGTMTSQCEAATLPNIGENRDEESIARFPSEQHVVAAFPSLGLSLSAPPNVVALQSRMLGSAAFFHPVCPAGFQENAAPWYQDEDRSAFWEQPGSACTAACPTWVYTMGELRLIAISKAFWCMLSFLSGAYMLYAWHYFSKKGTGQIKLMAICSLAMDFSAVIYALLVLIQPELLCAGGSATPGSPSSWGAGARAPLPFSFLAWLDFLRLQILIPLWSLCVDMTCWNLTVTIMYPGKTLRDFPHFFILSFYHHFINGGIWNMFCKFGRMKRHTDYTESPFRKGNAETFGYNPFVPLLASMTGWMIGYPADLELYHHNRGITDPTGGFSEKLYEHFDEINWRFTFWVSTVMSFCVVVSLITMRHSYRTFLVIPKSSYKTIYFQLIYNFLLPVFVKWTLLLARKAGGDISRNIVTHMSCVFDAVRSGLDATATCGAGPDVSSRIPVWFLCTLGIIPEATGVWFIPMFGMKRQIVVAYAKKFPHFAQTYCKCVLSYYGFAASATRTFMTTHFKSSVLSSSVMPMSVAEAPVPVPEVKDSVAVLTPIQEAAKNALLQMETETGNNLIEIG